MGTGTMTITAAPTLNIDSTTISSQYAFVDLFHSGLESYYGVINYPPTVNDLIVPSTAGAPVDSPAPRTVRFDPSLFLLAEGGADYDI